LKRHLKKKGMSKTRERQATRRRTGGDQAGQIRKAPGKPSSVSLSEQSGKGKYLQTPISKEICGKERGKLFKEPPKAGAGGGAFRDKKEFDKEKEACAGEKNNLPHKEETALFEGERKVERKVLLRG